MQCSLTGVADGSYAQGPLEVGNPDALLLGVELLEGFLVAAPRREVEFAGPGMPGSCGNIRIRNFETGESFEDVAGPRSIIDWRAGGVAEFAVVDDLNAGVDLIAYDCCDGFAQRPGEVRVAVRFASESCPIELNQRSRPRQAADMRGEHPVFASFHRTAPPVSGAQYTHPN